MTAPRLALLPADGSLVVVPKEIADLIQLWFEPWGARKAAHWEMLAGDIGFTEENCLRALSRMLAARPPVEGVELPSIDEIKAVLRRAESDWWDDIGGHPDDYRARYVLALLAGKQKEVG